MKKIKDFRHSSKTVSIETTTIIGGIVVIVGLLIMLMLPAWGHPLDKSDKNVQVENVQGGVTIQQYDMSVASAEYSAAVTNIMKTIIFEYSQTGVIDTTLLEAAWFHVTIPDSSKVREFLDQYHNTCIHIADIKFNTYMESIPFSQMKPGEDSIIYLQSETYQACQNAKVNINHFN